MIEKQKKIFLIFSLILIFDSVDASAEYRRSIKAKNEFKYNNPCPSNGSIKGACPGHIIDHIKPLACGGIDHPSNMQWQTKEEAKQKDKWERVGCMK